MDSINKILANFRRDPITSWCGIVFLASFYISNNPDSVLFLGPSVANFLVGLSNLLKGLSGGLGLLFAAQSRPETLVQEDVIKEVLTENQPEGKIELMADEDPKKIQTLTHPKD